MSEQIVVIETGEILWVPIGVTSQHIENGIAGICEQCPIALAFADVLSGEIHADVRDDEIKLRRRNDEVYGHPITGEPSKFVTRFDFFANVQPFLFMFPVPAHLLNPEVAQAAKRLELERALAMLVRTERAQSKCGLSRSEEYEEAAMRG